MQLDRHRAPCHQLLPADNFHVQLYSTTEDRSDFPVRCLRSCEKHPIGYTLHLRCHQCNRRPCHECHRACAAMSCWLGTFQTGAERSEWVRPLSAPSCGWSSSPSLPAGEYIMQNAVLDLLIEGSAFMLSPALTGHLSCCTYVVPTFWIMLLAYVGNISRMRCTEARWHLVRKLRASDCWLVLAPGKRQQAGRQS